MCVSERGKGDGEGRGRADVRPVRPVRARAGDVPSPPPPPPLPLPLPGRPVEQGGRRAGQPREEEVAVALARAEMQESGIQFRKII